MVKGFFSRRFILVLELVFNGGPIEKAGFFSAF